MRKIDSDMATTTTREIEDLKRSRNLSSLTTHAHIRPFAYYANVQLKGRSTRLALVIAAHYGAFSSKATASDQCARSDKIQGHIITNNSMYIYLVYTIKRDATKENKCIIYELTRIR